MNNSDSTLFDSSSLASDLHFCRTGILPTDDLLCKNPDCVGCTRKDNCIELISSACRMELLMLLGIEGSALDHEGPVKIFDNRMVDLLRLYYEDIRVLFGREFSCKLLGKETNRAVTAAFLSVCGLKLRQDDTITLKRLDSI